MSLRARIAHHGERATAFRPVASSRADASRGVGAWTPLTPTVRLMIQPANEAQVTKVHGIDDVATHQAFIADDNPALATNDRLLVTRGQFAGQRFRVASRKPWMGYGRNGHLELALESTKEVFP